MRLFSRTPLAALALAASGAALADVQVEYVHPETFSDLPFSTGEREQVLKDLSAHFLELGRRLPADEHLRIVVSDIDLAGRAVPSRRQIDAIRVMRGETDWPHMRLHYTLEQNGKVIASGDGDLNDMDYLHGINRYSSGDSLRYEKKMIDDWFAGIFGAGRHG